MRARQAVPRIDFRPRTTAWALFDDCVWTVRDDVIEQRPYDALILATGSTDRTMPVPGWTLPGALRSAVHRSCSRDRVL